MKSDRKPPLAKSPMRLRGRFALRPPNSNTLLRTPAASAKPQMKELENKPQYHSVSYELRALAKMVQDELGAINANNTDLTNNASIGANTPFQRGRFYDVYSARRNERLRKKLSESGDDEPKTAYNLGVKVDSTAKKKDSKKKADSLKKSMMAAATHSVDRSQHPRYALRSAAKKPPLPVPMNVEEKTVTTRRASTRARRK